MSEPTPLNLGPTDAYDERPAPISARDHLLEVVAMEVATGTKLAVIARRHDYSYGGMRALIESEALQERVGYYRRRLEYAKDIAQKKVLLHLDALTDTELNVALPFDGNEEVPYAVKLKAQSSAVSQRARQYLMDKVWPTVQKVDHSVEHQMGAAEMEVIQSFKGLMDRLKAEKAERTIDILASPHVKEGVDALPSPMAGRMLAEQNRR